MATLDKSLAPQSRSGAPDTMRPLVKPPRPFFLRSWFALVLVIAAGIFGMVAAVVSEELEGLFYAGPFTAFGVVGLLALRKARGPVDYKPKEFIAAWDEGRAADGKHPTASS